MEDKIILTDCNVSAAKAVFQRYSPSGLAVEYVNLLDYGTHHEWDVTYHNCNRAAPEFNQLLRVKGLIQSVLHGIANVGSVCIRRSPNHVSSWNVIVKPIYFSGITRENTKNEVKVSPPPGPTYNGFSVLIKRGNNILFVKPSEVLESDLPRKLFQDGKHVTSKFTYRNSLCRTVFNIIKDNLQKGASNVKALLRNPRRRKEIPPVVTFVPSDDEFPTLVENATTALEVETIPSSPIVAKPSYAAVAFNYEQFEDKIRLSKFNDPRVFRAARLYILSNAGELGLKTSPIIFKAFRKIELANILRSEGLPTDSSLIKLYQRYCTERDICSDVLTELNSERDYALKAGIAVRNY